MLARLKTILSKIFLTWYIPLLTKGSTGKSLEFRDLDKFVPFTKHTSRNLGSRLSAEWNSELKYSQEYGKPPSLLRAIVQTFKITIILTGIIKFCARCIFDNFDRICFWIIIQHFSMPDSTDWFCYACVGLIVFSGLKLYSLSIYYHRSETLGIEIKTACSSLLYTKALRLNHASLRSTGIGQMVNLLSSDGLKLESVFEIHHLWVGPIQVCTLTALAWYHMGVACIPGIALSIGVAIFQARRGELLGKCRLEAATATDRRLKVMSEIIGAIRTIKMYAWEVPFSKLIQDRRRAETDIIQKHYQLRLTNWILYCCTSSVTIFLVITTYAIINGNTPSAATMFLCMRLFSRLRVFLTVDLTKGLQQLNDFRVSVKRFQDFLLLEELPQPRSESGIDSDQKVQILAENVTAGWDSADQRCDKRSAISGLHLEVSSPKLIAVIGGVGSGKSSLLLTLLRELPISSGKLKTFGRIAYVPQQPWIFAGTIRENILFGKTYNAVRYAEVIEACALEQDFKIFPNGDMTAVSEGGSTLSGGQQARVSLARAVYADADIYLLDTPLSCVDPNVGKHILQNCILGLLRNKIRIVTTHQLDLIRSADSVYMLENGTVRDFGAPEKFLEISDNAFQTALTKIKPADHEDFNMEEPAPLLEPVEIRSESKSGAAAGVPLQAYYDYYKAGIISTEILSKIVGFTVMLHLLLSGSEYWLKFCVREDFTASTALTRLAINAVISAMLLVISKLQMSTYIKISTEAGHRFHNEMLQRVMHAPMGFFNKNNPGHILQRFSGDQSKVDEVLPFTMFYTLTVCIRSFVIILFVVLTMNSVMMIPGVLLIIIAFKLQKMHVRTARSLHVLDNEAKSPVLSHLSSSMDGISTIRAFGLSTEMATLFNSHLDVQFKASFAKMTGVTWISAAIETAVALFLNVLIVSIMFLSAGAAEVGFSLSAAYSLTNGLAWAVASTSSMENQMKSAENILEFHKIEPEKSSSPALVEDGQNLPENWPSAGEIVFKDVSLEYVPGVKVLKGISIRISAGQKIGIVGRTGAGKSSLLAALFRLQEPKGIIEIDGVDIRSISLQDLRPKISIIPQNPVLFEGTLRTNLDPFDEFSNEEVVDSLQVANLSQFIARSSLGIHMQIDEGGSNLSVGEKQLICMARAVLRKSKILVSDEPTSSIDFETSAVIHEKIGKIFKGCTVLTIAHRVSTVLDCDKIIVMHEGEIKEFDSPQRLLANPASFFRQHVASYQ